MTHPNTMTHHYHHACHIVLQASGAALGSNGKWAAVGVWGAVDKACDATISHMV